MGIEYSNMCQERGKVRWQEGKSRSREMHSRLIDRRQTWDAIAGYSHCNLHPHPHLTLDKLLSSLFACLGLRCELLCVERLRPPSELDMARGLPKNVGNNLDQGREKLTRQWMSSLFIISHLQPCLCHNKNVAAVSCTVYLCVHLCLCVRVCVCVCVCVYTAMCGFRVIYLQMQWRKGEEKITRTVGQLFEAAVLFELAKRKREKERIQKFCPRKEREREKSYTRTQLWFRQMGRISWSNFSTALLFLAISCLAEIHSLSLCVHEKKSSTPTYKLTVYSTHKIHTDTYTHSWYFIDSLFLFPLSLLFPYVSSDKFTPVTAVAGRKESTYPKSPYHKIKSSWGTFWLFLYERERKWERERERERERCVQWRGP